MGIVEMFLTDHTFRIVSLGSVMLGITSGVIGSFAVQRRQGLLGDAVSHAALPGIAIAFLLLQVKSMEWLMLGAMIAGLFSAGLITIIDRYSRVKTDTAMALILSAMFGAGLMLLTMLQKVPNANQAGLEHYIFGQASTLLRRDIWLIGIVSVVLLSIVTLFWKEFKLVCFDPEYADSLGYSSRAISNLLSALTVIAIVLGLQTVGVILMSSLLVAPGVAARQWTDRFSVMVFLSGSLGGLSGFLGTWISSSLSKMPTGPSIVLIVSFFVVISLLFAPRRGIVWSVIRSIRNRSHIRDLAKENRKR